MKTGSANCISIGGSADALEKRIGELSSRLCRVAEFVGGCYPVSPSPEQQASGLSGSIERVHLSAMNCEEHLRRIEEVLGVHELQKTACVDTTVGSSNRIR